MGVKISIDGSAELLTPNPLPRNFNFKIITKIQTFNGRNSENRPLDKLEEYEVLLKTLHFDVSLLKVPSNEKCQLFQVWTSAIHKPHPFPLLPPHPEWWKILLFFLKLVSLDIKLMYVLWTCAAIIELRCGQWTMVSKRKYLHPFPTYTWSI